MELNGPQQGQDRPLFGRKKNQRQSQFENLNCEFASFECSFDRFRISDRFRLNSYRNIRSSHFVSIDLTDSDIILFFQVHSDTKVVVRIQIFHIDSKILIIFSFLWKIFIANQEALKIKRVYTIVCTVFDNTHKNTADRFRNIS